MTLSTSTVSPSSVVASQANSMTAPCKPLYRPALRTMAACSFAAAALVAAHGAAHAQAVAPQAATAPAAAAPPAPRQLTSTEVNAAFDRADENHDARLTRTEAERFPEVARRFEQIDANRDTFISREEFNKAVTGAS